MAPATTLDAATPVAIGLPGAERKPPVQDKGGGPTGSSKDDPDQGGITVTNVEIKHIDLNESMVRAIARQAEAKRERRAKVIHAEGEKQASAALLEAARMLAQQPEAMQLRYLQTMTQVAGDRARHPSLPRKSRLDDLRRGWPRRFPWQVGLHGWVDI